MKFWENKDIADMVVNIDGIEHVEEWKFANGYEGLYQVSSLGRIKSMYREWQDKIKEPHIMSGGYSRGYLNVTFTKNGVFKTVKPHRMVAGLFLEKEPGKRFVNHKNGNKKDNSKFNLEWCTMKENAKHARDNKLFVAPSGTKHYKATKIICSTLGVEFGSIKAASSELGICRTLISRVCRGISSCVDGLYFRYICTIALILLSASSMAQGLPTGVPTQKINGWAEAWYYVPDSGVVAPKNTPTFTPRFPGTMITYQNAGVDTSLHYWTGGRWVKISLSQIDTTSLSNRINLKLNISDTASMLLPYLRKADTANKWVQNVYARNDSLFRQKNGTETFVHSFATSGSGTVTSVGISMPSAFTVTNSPITTSGTIGISGAGTSLQYIRGNGTLATTDTGMIPDFTSKVRGLFSGTSPITYNSSTGAISLNDVGVGGSCNNCDLTIDSKGRVTLFSDGAGSVTVDTIFRTSGIDSIYFTLNGTLMAIKDSVGHFSTNNIGTGFAWVATPTGNIKRVASSNTILWDSTSTANTLTAKADTSVLATQYDLTQAVLPGYGVGVSGSIVRVDTTVIDGRYKKRFNVINFGADPDSNSSDDCPAIKAAIQAAFAYGADRSTVYFPLGHYTLGCPLQHSVDGVDPDAQIVLPLSRDTATRKPRIVFEGEAPQNWSAELVTVAAKNKRGVILESTILDTGYVFGSSFYTDAGFGGDINWTWWAFKNIEIRVRSKTGGTQVTPTMSGINSEAPRSIDFDHVKVTVQSSEGNMLEPYSGTIGVKLPHWNNNANIMIDLLNISGYYNGLYAGEHMNATELVTFNCYNGIYLPYAIHSGYIAQYTSEGCVNHVYVSNETGPFSGGPMDLHIGSYNIEHYTTPAQWNTYAYDVLYADTSANNTVSIDYAHMAESGVGEIYVFNTNAPQRVNVGHNGRRASYLSRFYTTYYDAIEPIQWTPPTGTNRNFQILNSTNGTNNLAEPQLYPGSGTNVGVIASLIPRGTGFNSTLKSAWNVFNTNYIADPTNWELFQFKAAGNDFLIGALSSGTGSLRPIRFQMNGSDAFYVNTDRNIHLNTDVRFGLGTSSVTDDVIKFQNNNTGATMQIQNNSGSGFSGIEYFNNSGAGAVFTGFNNSNNQEFRFNNFISGGYIRFLTGGTEKLKINNSGGVTFNNAFTLPGADGTSNQVLQTNGSGIVSWATISGVTTLYTGNGTLGSDRNVSSGGFTLRVDGANNSDTLVSITNTGTSSVGLYSLGSLFGIDAQSTNVGLRAFGTVTGLLATGDGSEGAVIKSNTIRGATIQTVPSSTNTVIEVLRLERGVNGSPGANGIGGYMSFYNKRTDNSSVEGNTIASKFTDAVAATLTSQLYITGTNSGTPATIWTLDGDGTTTTTGKRKMALVNSSAGTLTLGNAEAYIFTGTTTTWTLPAVSGTTGTIYYIKNIGSGSITLNADSGNNEIYTSSAVNTTTITAGSAIILISNNTYWTVN